ncbi:MAG: GNAT family N-acetyltransferase [Anaerolineaceae bacterium]
MDVSIREILNPSPADLTLRDESFVVDTVLVLHASDNRITYTFKPVPPYRKTYPSEQDGETLYPGGSERTAFIAYAGGTRAGRILLKKAWNNLAYIDDLCVESDLRGQGIGSRLLACADEWARRNHLPGIMLETQHNNAAACRLYARCGYTLCGFNTHLYQGIPVARDEIALFWHKTL